MSLILEGDSPELREQIKELLELGYPVARPSAFHIKIGPVNFYPTRGKITQDPCIRLEPKGFAALLQHLEKLKIARKCKKSKDDLKVKLTPLESDLVTTKLPCKKY